MSSEFEKFDAVVRKVFSVPRAEIERREKLYQRRRKRAKQKRATNLATRRQARND